MDACCSIYILPFATCVQAKVGADDVVAAMHDVTIYNNTYDALLYGCMMSLYIIIRSLAV